MRIPLVFGLLLACASPAMAQQADQRLVSCVAHIVYGEARDEPLEGRYMVAWSLVFRAAVNLQEFGGSDICSVAYKYSPGRWQYDSPGRWQYDGAKIGPKDDAAWDAAVYVATMTLLGEGQPNLPIMFFCSVHVPGACRWHDRALQNVGRVGGHQFYLDPRFPALMEASAPQ